MFSSFTINRASRKSVHNEASYIQFCNVVCIAHIRRTFNIYRVLDSGWDQLSHRAGLMWFVKVVQLQLVVRGVHVRSTYCVGTHTWSRQTLPRDLSIQLFLPLCSSSPSEHWLRRDVPQSGVAVRDTGRLNHVERRPLVTCMKCHISKSYSGIFYSRVRSGSSHSRYDSREPYMIKTISHCHTDSYTICQSTK